MVYATLLHLIIQILIELSEFFHTVGNTVPQVLKRFWLFVAFTINFEEGLIVSPDNVDTESITFGTFWMVRSAATLIVTGDCDANHIATNCTDICVFLAAVYEVKPFNFPRHQVVCALRTQHIARYVHELPHPLMFDPLLYDPYTKVCLSPLELYIMKGLLNVRRGASQASYKKYPP